MVSSTLVLTLVVQALLPLAVGLVTKKSTNSKVKSLLLGLLTAANATCLGLLGGVPVMDIAVTAVIGLATSLGTHYGIYKPLGATEAVQNTLVVDQPTPAAESPAAAESDPSTHVSGGGEPVPAEASPEDEAQSGYDSAPDLSIEVLEEE